MKSCGLTAHCIAGVDSGDLACMTTENSLEVQGLLRWNGIHLTKWDKSIFSSSLAKLVFRLGLREEKGGDPQIKRRWWTELVS